MGRLPAPSFETMHYKLKVPASWLSVELHNVQKLVTNTVYGFLDCVIGKFLSI